MIQFENILEDFYKSPGVLNVGLLISKSINIMPGKFIYLRGKTRRAIVLLL